MLEYCNWIRGTDEYGSYSRFLLDRYAVKRASGLCICEICGKDFYSHPKYRYPTNTNGAARACNGEYLHL